MSTKAVKNSIQKGLGYTVGAIKVSEQLIGIPPFDDIELCF